MPAESLRTYRLADIEPNAMVRVRYIVFDTLRDLCFGIGLREGDRFRCEQTGPDSIVLADAGGRSIRLDPEWARFIGVCDCELQTELATTSPAGVRDWEPRSDPAPSDLGVPVPSPILRTLERNRLEQELGRS